MIDADRILEALRAKPEHLDGLMELIVDDVLSRPVAELVDPPWLAARLVESLRAASADAAFEDRLRERLRSGLAATTGETGSLAERVPAEVVRPLRVLVRKPYTPDAGLLRELLDHRAVRALIRDVLHDATLRFAHSLRAAVPDPRRGRRGRGRGRLSSLVGAAQGVAQGVASAVGSEVERQLEGRVRAFVDGAIGRSLDRSVSHLSGRDAAADLGAWRVHALDVLIRRPADRARADLDRLDAEGLVSDLADALRALADWEGLADQVRRVVETAVEAGGDRTVGEVIETAPLPDGWRAEVAAPLRQRAQELVASEAFARWLGELIAGVQA